MFDGRYSPLITSSFSEKIPERFGFYRVKASLFQSFWSNLRRGEVYTAWIDTMLDCPRITSSLHMNFKKTPSSKKFPRRLTFHVCFNHSVEAWRMSLELLYSPHRVVPGARCIIGTTWPSLDRYNSWQSTPTLRFIFIFRENYEAVGGGVRARFSSQVPFNHFRSQGKTWPVLACAWAKNAQPKKA